MRILTTEEVADMYRTLAVAYNGNRPLRTHYSPDEVRNLAFAALVALRALESRAQAYARASTLSGNWASAAKQTCAAWLTEAQAEIEREVRK